MDLIVKHFKELSTTELYEILGCTEPEIAKTLSFIVVEKPVIVVMAGAPERGNNFK